MIVSGKVFLLAVLACGAWASPSVHDEQDYGKPKVIEESDYIKHCPSGFEMIGKRCVKTIVASPNAVCPHGTIKVDNKCVEYVGKQSECPHGYEQKEEGCVKIIKVQQEVACPHGFVLSGTDKCVQKIPLPEIYECPVGSLLKGDKCIKIVTETPEYVCPKHYHQIGSYCQHEVKFDCTPTRKPREQHKFSKHESNLRHSEAGKEQQLYHLSVDSPIVEEYVVQETCKRVITEDARATCLEGGVLNGKHCEKNLIVQPIIKPGGYHDIYAPAYAHCPEGFLETTTEGECLSIDYAPTVWFCPQHTVDVGKKCAIYSEPKKVCPEHFYMTGKTCAQTVFAAPMVEYTVKYACTGKDCIHRE